MITEYDEYIDRYITCINEARYYDAHEALEEIWFPRRFEENDEMNLIKGFINASVSFELIKRGRPKASEKVWKNYEKYIVLLESVQSPYSGRYQDLSRFVEEKRAQLV